MLRPAVENDTPGLVALAVSTGLFRPEEADALLKRTLDDLHAGRLGDGHAAQVWAAGPDAAPVGWVYFGPEEKADGVWNVWWIGVSPDRQGQGIGDELLRFVEANVKAARGRLLVIETSSLPALERTRTFYTKKGYTPCGVVPDFYGDGDGKVTFAKRVDGVAPRA